MIYFFETSPSKYWFQTARCAFSDFIQSRARKKVKTMGWGHFGSYASKSAIAYADDNMVLLGNNANTTKGPMYTTYKRSKKVGIRLSILKKAEPREFSSTYITFSTIDSCFLRERPFSNFFLIISCPYLISAGRIIRLLYKNM